MSDADFIREVEELYQRIAEAHTSNFVELAKIAGLDIKTDLVGANLTEANLTEANLTEANLSGADLRWSNLVGANLRWSNLVGANLSGADLTEANLSGADLKNTQIDEKTVIADKWRLVWQILNVRDANRQLTQVDLSEADLRWSNLVGADLRLSNLSKTNLVAANLSHANLIGTDLTEANLIYTNLSETKLHKTIVKMARFGFNQGISKELKQDLIDRGAIFEDAPGDRSGVLVPVGKR